MAEHSAADGWAKLFAMVKWPWRSRRRVASQKRAAVAAMREISKAAEMANIDFELQQKMWDIERLIRRI